MRLVFILQDLEFGGTQRQTLRLASRLNPDLFSVEVWVLCSGGGFVPKALEMGIPVRFLSRKNYVGVSAIFNLCRVLACERPDVVIPFTVVPNIWCRLFGRMLGVSLIIGTCRGGGAIVNQWERLLWRLAHHHICNAEFLRASLIEDVGVSAERVSVIENGIEVPDAFPPNGEEEGRNILCVGRLVEDKNHETLIRAFALVVRKHADARLTIVGDGPLLGELQTLAASFNLSGNISFIPGQSGLEPLYRDCDVFALSSIREASPNVIIEAAAAGKPVVATNVGGVSRLVEDGETGLLVPAHAFEEMAGKLDLLLEDGEMRRSMGQAARTYVQSRFGVGRMVEKYETLLAKLCGLASAMQDRP